MIEFLLEAALQSIVCFLGFLAGIMYERDRLKRHNSRPANKQQNSVEFRAWRVWYKQTPYQDISEEI